MENSTILKTEEVSKIFFANRGNDVFSIRGEPKTVKAVQSVTLELREGEALALVGESGSGKTTLGYMLARIFKPTSGGIWFEGKDVTFIEGRALKEFRRKVQMVFQDPGSTLNPRHTIQSSLSLPLRIFTSLSRQETRERVIELLSAVHLPAEIRFRYPGALSGGQKQRVNLARALALNPRLIVLDEPTSALDVSVQAKILQLLLDLKNERKLTYLFITHDLSVVKNIADRIAVMYLGRVVELGDTVGIFGRPFHPYSRALLSAIPVVTDAEKKLLPAEIILEGDVPSPENPPETCPFLSRCQEKIKVCEESPCPNLKRIEENHFVRCWLMN
jgi:oligopeptide/dipeptide ABC transporter ATP-binding protein